MSKKGLMNLLTDVASDAAQGVALKKDPDAYLAGCDLEDTEKEAVKKTLETGDHTHIHNALKDDGDQNPPANVQVNILL